MSKILVYSTKKIYIYLAMHHYQQKKTEISKLLMLPVILQHQ